MKKVIMGLTLIIALSFAAYYLIYLRPNPNPPSLPEKMQNSNSPTITYDQIETIVENLEVPWETAFLPDGRMLITERPGRVQIVDNNSITQIANISEVKTTGESGLHGIAIDPDFKSNNFVYLYYTYSSNGQNTLNKVMRYKFENNKLLEDKMVIDGIPGAIFHDGGRIKFGPDGYLYIATGDAREPSLAQDKNSLAGKILRVTRDGEAPSDNPFVVNTPQGKSSGDSRVYSYGHRNPQGIVWDDSGQLWETEHGPSGTWPDCCQDEVNKITKGGNYGWPGSVGDTVESGTIGPVIHSGRDIWAPAGMAYVDGKIYFTGLRSSVLYSFDLSNPSGTLKEYFKDEFGRLRNVLFHEGGFFLSTSNRDGRGVPGGTDDKIIRIDASSFQ